MNLESILLYQKKDIELRRILDEIERHEFNKKLEQAKNEFSAAKTSIAENERDAESIVNFFNKSIAYYDDSVKKSDEIVQKLSGLGEDELDSRRELISQLEILRNKMAELEKRLTERRAKADSVIHAYLDAQERGKKLRDYYNETKLKLDNFRNEKEPQIQAIQKELDSMKKDIDPKLFEQYKAITNERKYPAVVEAGTMDGGKNYSCKGCGLSLSQKGRSELIEKNVCRCENCRRIIYKV